MPSSAVSACEERNGPSGSLTLSGGDVPLVACSQHDLSVAALQAKQFILPHPAAFPRLQRAGWPHGRQVTAVGVAECHFSGEELQHEAGVLVRFCGQAPVIAQEAVIRGFQVVTLVAVHQGYERIDPPGNVAVHRHLLPLPLRAQVGETLPREAVQVNLRVHGQMHAPFLCRRGSLREAGNPVLAAPEVAAMGLRLQGPPPVFVRSDHEAAVPATRLAVRSHVAVFVRGEVAAQVGEEEHGAAVLPGLLQRPRLLLFQTAGWGVDFKAESLRRQILPRAVDEPQRDLQQVPVGAVCGHDGRRICVRKEKRGCGG